MHIYNTLFILIKKKINTINKTKKNIEHKLIEISNDLYRHKSLKNH